MRVFRSLPVAAALAALALMLTGCPQDGGAPALVSPERPDAALLEVYLPPEADAAALPDAGEGDADAAEERVCPPRPEPEDGPPSCAAWECEALPWPDCWSCGPAPVPALDETACGDAEGRAGVCWEGRCVPAACWDANPCTVDAMGEGACLHAPFCVERPRTVCVVEDGRARCLCDPGWVEDAAGECRAPGGEETGETCGAAVRLPAHDQTLRGSTAGAGDDLAPGCLPEGGGEVVYAFALTGETRVTATLSEGRAALALFGRADCAPGDEVACDDGRWGAAPTIGPLALPPGNYRLVVEAAAGDGGGPFALDLVFEEGACTAGACPPGFVCEMDADWSKRTCRCPDGQMKYRGRCVPDPCQPNPCGDEEGRTRCAPAPPDAHECLCEEPWWREGEDGACVRQEAPTGETCDIAVPLALDDGPQSFEVDLPSRVDDYHGSCGGFGEEAVYAFEVTAPGYLDVTARGPDTLLYLRTDCEDQRSEVEGACTGGSRLGVPLAAPGTYFLFVDVAGTADRPASVTVDLRADPCADGGGCGPGQLCVADEEWTGAVCECPEGALEWDGGCVPDPCAGEPCRAAWGDESVCRVALPDAFECACWPGFARDGGEGPCAPAAEGREWTVMVYLNADNDLHAEGLRDLNELTSVGSTDEVTVVVQLDTLTGPGRRLYVAGGEAVELEPLGEPNMGDWKELARFGHWGVTHYPARRYALVLWNHGLGWYKSAPAGEAPWKSFSSDETSGGQSISVADGSYARALERIAGIIGGPIDVVGFDACLMGMWEVAHVTARFARFFVGSEENIPGTGWPYHHVLQGLLAAPSAEGDELARIIVQAYHDERTQNATLAASDLATLPALDEALSAFADELMDDPEGRAAVNAVRGELDTYGWADFVDLYDLARRVSERGEVSPGTVDAAIGVMEAVERTVLLSLTNGSGYGNTYGLSVYLPNHRYASGYTRAEWSEASSWDEFLRGN